MNAEALERTVSALEDLGRLNPVDDALVELCRSAAQALDEHPARATLVKEYRECLMALAVLGMDDDGSDFGELVAAINAGAAVEHAPEDRT